MIIGRSRQKDQKHPAPEDILTIWLQNLENHKDRPAVSDAGGLYTYAQLWQESGAIAAGLLDGRSDLEEEAVAFLMDPGFAWVSTLLGIWRAGGMAVPLCITHPPAELRYAIETTGARRVLAGPSREEQLSFIPVTRLADLAAPAGARLPEPGPERRAMILFTSGTTSRPKGVVSTHGIIGTWIRSLQQAWEYRAEDRLLHFLPLHHLHGVLNKLLVPLASGARVDMLPRFDPAVVGQHIRDGGYSLFMAVPTIYSKLIAWMDSLPAAERQELAAGFSAMRLMVSGSAALPVPVLERWQQLTGHFLLERYGMTEIGMAIGNPLHGRRRAGSIGRPLPGVTIRLADEAGREVPAGEPGEILVQGKGVFLEYWQNPGATTAAFRDGWFLTGDMAVLEDGFYRILGRTSVDIIKSGGYKISALEIEEVYRRHPGIKDIAVIGMPDEEWGEVICAAVLAETGRAPTLEELKDWGKDRLAPYKLPRRMEIPEDFPRNAMGKVMKPELKTLFGKEKVQKG